jgi:type IV secretion system protein VirD4
MMNATSAGASDRFDHECAVSRWTTTSPGASTVKLVLGGLAGDDLREVSELAGEWRETVITWQRGEGGQSLSSTLQDRRTMTPQQVRTLSAQQHEGLVIHSTTPAVIVQMTRARLMKDRIARSSPRQCGSRG